MALAGGGFFFAFGERDLDVRIYVECACRNRRSSSLFIRTREGRVHLMQLRLVFGTQVTRSKHNVDSLDVGREALIFCWFLLMIVSLADLHESQNQVYITNHPTN